MTATHSDLKATLVELENLLRGLQLWSTSEPPAQALVSKEPFAWDMLSFDQWLQFIFIPKLLAMAESEAPLPASSGVAPMAEEFFAATAVDGSQVVQLLRHIDGLISG